MIYCAQECSKFPPRCIHQSGSIRVGRIMAGVQLWTLSSAERSILIIYSSELPTPGSRSPLPAQAQKFQILTVTSQAHEGRDARLCPAQLGIRGPNKPWKSISLPSWRHRPVNPSRPIFRAPASGPVLSGAPTRLQQVRSPGFVQCGDRSCTSLQRPVGG